MKLWRYIQYSKFVSLLQEKAIHFSRADKFSDPFEGSYPKKNMPNYSSVLDPTITYEAFKKYAAISCWHINSDESEAMWELYLKNSDGVAIVTDERTLEKCLEGSEASLVRVKYKNYFKDRINDFSWFSAFEYKRNCFKHEREVRAIKYLIPQSLKIINGFPELAPPDGKNCIPEYGIKVEVDLSKLINRIVVSPNSGPWFEQVVRDTLENFNLSKVKVCKSELKDDPLYPKWTT